MLARTGERANCARIFGETVITSALAAFSVALGLLASDARSHDDRAAWRNYVWKTVEFNGCKTLGADGFCHSHHQKWDWKRNQWVDFSYRIDRKSGSLKIRFRLDNRDPGDRDDVCVTALFLDEQGRNILAFHENVSVRPGQVLEKMSTAKASAKKLAHISRISVGSKQCRRGPHEDDDVFQRAIAEISG